MAFEKLSPDEFNEIGFLDPGGQMVTVLESRTFSPAPFGDRGFSRLGQFTGYELPCRDPQASEAFWSGLGRAPDSGRLGTADILVEFDAATDLTCHYRGDVLALAEFAARQGLHAVTVSADERRAVVKMAGGPVFVVSQAS